MAQMALARSPETHYSDLHILKIDINRMIYIEDIDIEYRVGSKVISFSVCIINIVLFIT